MIQINNEGAICIYECSTQTMTPAMWYRGGIVSSIKLYYCDSCKAKRLSPEMPDGLTESDFLRYDPDQ